MKPALNKCPVCDGELVVTRLRCMSCDTAIEGSFANSVFPGLDPEQLDFIEIFIRCEGKINRMETELNLSYPTIRNRLNEIIRAMGYEPGRDEAPEITDELRRNVLEDLDSGKISAEDAMRILQGEEK